jgi:hypothetical protein
MQPNPNTPESPSAINRQRQPEPWPTAAAGSNSQPPIPIRSQRQPLRGLQSDFNPGMNPNGFSAYAWLHPLSTSEIPITVM